MKMSRTKNCFAQSSNVVCIIKCQKTSLFLGIGQLDIRNANAHNIRKVTSDIVSTDGKRLILLSVISLNSNITIIYETPCSTLGTI